MNKSDKLILEFYHVVNVYYQHNAGATKEQQALPGWGDYEKSFNAVYDRGKELHERQLMEKASIATDEHNNG